MATSSLRAGIAALAVLLSGCMTMQTPPGGWVKDSPAARRQTLGATISIRYRDHQGFHQTLGELIAVEERDVLVLSVTELSAIPLAQVTHYEIHYTDPTHGDVTLVGTRPGKGQSAFARFPQGVPDRDALRQSLMGPAANPPPAGAPDSLDAPADSLKR